MLNKKAKCKKCQQYESTYIKFKRKQTWLLWGGLRDWGLGSWVAAAAAAKSLQSCPTLCDPIDGSPPGSSVPGSLQARILEWVAMSFSNAWKWKVKVKSFSLVQLFATPWTVAYWALYPWEFPGKEYWNGLPFPSPQMDMIFCQIFTYLLK